MKTKWGTVLFNFTIAVQLLQNISIYGQYRDRMYKSLKGHVRRHNILYITTVKSVSQCAMLCMSEPLCKFFNLENKTPSGSRNCEVVGGGSQAFISPEADASYTLYYKECPAKVLYEGIYLGSCYTLRVADMTWAQATTYCQSLGEKIHVLQIESEDEYDALNTWMTANSGFLSTSTDGWLGGKRLDDNKDISWVATMEPIGYNKFAGTSHLTKTGEESCVKMMMNPSAYPNLEFIWYATNCNLVMKWTFCEA